MKKGKPNLAVVLLLLICIVLLGVVVYVMYYTTKGNADAELIYQILLWVGVALIALVLITLFSYLSASRKFGKRKKQRAVEDEEEDEPQRKAKKQKKQKPVKQPKPEKQPKQERRPEPPVERKQPEPVAEVKAELDSSSTHNGAQVNYMPSQQAYQQSASSGGKVQSIDEKFEQIGKMGKAQFVIYMSKLFKLKGYQVELTPVANNHGIDMMVEKMGVKIAVGCALSNKVLGETDVRLVEQGKKYYGIDRAMVVTNQYFDRMAAAYGKSQSTSLVDRNVLAEDFMR